MTTRLDLNGRGKQWQLQDTDNMTQHDTTLTSVQYIPPNYSHILEGRDVLFFNCAKYTKQKFVMTFWSYKNTISLISPEIHASLSECFWLAWMYPVSSSESGDVDGLKQLSWKFPGCREILGWYRIYVMVDWYIAWLLDHLMENCRDPPFMTASVMFASRFTHYSRQLKGQEDVWKEWSRVAGYCAINRFSKDLEICKTHLLVHSLPLQSAES